MSALLGEALLVGLLVLMVRAEVASLIAHARVEVLREASVEVLIVALVATLLVGEHHLVLHLREVGRVAVLHIVLFDHFLEVFGAHGTVHLLALELLVEDPVEEVLSALLTLLGHDVTLELVVERHSESLLEVGAEALNKVDKLRSLRKRDVPNHNCVTQLRESWLDR